MNGDPGVADHGRVALVTGGAGAGIGHGISLELAEAGWSLVLVDRDEEALGTLVRKIEDSGGKAAGLAVDVTEEDAAARAVGTAVQRFGRLDGLVNNAGVGLSRTVEATKDDDVLHLFAIDYMAAFRFIREALPELRKSRGAIVNIGSVHAAHAHPTYAVYASGKAALEALTRAVAVENGPHGVRANCIHPGYVDSPQNLALIRQFTGGREAEWIAGYRRTKQCIPEPVTARQVGALAAFLLGPSAATITGQRIFIDGGTSIMLYEREE